MTAIKSVEDLLAAGWSEIKSDGFVGHVGPLWEIIRGDQVTTGFFATQIHKNSIGVVQGGMLATLADRSLGRTVRLSKTLELRATIQLDIQYIDAARIGEFITATGKLLKETRSVAFASGILEADGRLIGNVTGVWRVKGKLASDKPEA